MPILPIKMYLKNQGKINNSPTKSYCFPQKLKLIKDNIKNIFVDTLSFFTPEKNHRKDHLFLRRISRGNVDIFFYFFDSNSEYLAHFQRYHSITFMSAAMQIPSIFAAH